MPASHLMLGKIAHVPMDGRCFEAVYVGNGVYVEFALVPEADITWRPGSWQLDDLDPHGRQRHWEMHCGR